MPNRHEKINELIKQEVGKIIHGEIEHKGYLVTISKVETSPDYKEAKVWVTILGAKSEEMFARLTRSVAYIQSLLNKKIVMHFVPKITFYFDHSLEYVDHIEKLLRDIKKKE